MKLYDLAEAYQNVWGLLENEDTDLTLVEQALQTVEGAIETKAGNIAIFIRSLDADAEAIKAEEKRLADRRRAIENKRDGIKQYLQMQMEAMGIDKVKTSTHTLSIQNNPPALQILDPEVIPQKFLTLIPEHFEVRKKDVADALKAGENVPGAELVRGRSLRIR